MIETKSVLKIKKSDRSYSLVCDPSSPLMEVQEVLIEMLTYVQSVIKKAEDDAKIPVEKPEAELIVDNEQTL